MSISSPAIRIQRIPAKFIYIQRLDKKKHVYDIGILDDKYNLYQHQICILAKAITYHCYDVLNKLFRPYLITKDTEIDFLDNIEKTEIIYMYLSIRNQAVFANMRFLNIDMIPRRIATYHSSYLGKPKKSSEVTKYYIERLWKKLVALEKCPWISAEVDQMLNNKSIAARKREVILRMALYYMIIKRFFVLKTQRLTEKKKNANKV